MRVAKLAVPILWVAVAAILPACPSKRGGEDPGCTRVPPVASAGATQTVPKNTAVQLLGSAAGASTAATYAWQLVTAPPSSTAALSPTGVAGASFKPDVAGVYVAALTVTDGCATSAPDKVAIVATDGVPVAVAGPNQTVEPGDTVTLDGSASGDPDRDAVSYAWTLVTRPYGSAATLTGATSAKPTFVADAPGAYVALLAVSDGASTSNPAATVIQAGGPGPGCSGVLPVANAGADRTLAGPGHVSLSGEGSRSSGGASLTYRWSLVSAPATSQAAFLGAGGWSTYLIADRAGVYVVSLVVNDGCADSAPAFVRITVPEVPPSVSISQVWESVPFGRPIQLHAWGSDPAGTTLTYAWTFASRPQGSTAAFLDASASTAIFTPDVVGQYVASVVVSNGKLSSSPATRTVTVVDSAPVASAGANQGVAVGALVTLDGSASQDPNGTSLTYAWTLKTPAGSGATLAASDSVHPSFTPDVPGVYVADLVASDGVTSASAKTTVSAWPPITRLTARVVDAVYAPARDELILVTTSPDALVLHDPRTHAERTVALAAAPTSVGVSPNGASAAVGHANAVTFVDLSGATPVATRLALNGTASSVAVADDGHVYGAATTAAGRAQVFALASSTGIERDALSTVGGSATARLRPGASGLYAAGDRGLQGYDVSSHVPVLVSTATSSSCSGPFWLTSAGDRLVTRCGTVLRASSSPADDLSPLGSLATTTVWTSLRHVADSTARGEISCIASGDLGWQDPHDDRTLRRFSAAGFSLGETAVFPVDPYGPTPWRGRYVFYRSDGTERYVVMQLESPITGAGEFGIATF